MKPLLAVIFDALKERGWTMPGNGSYVDPDDNVFGTVDQAITAQTFREIGEAGRPSPPPE